MSLPSYPNSDDSEFVEVDPTGRYGRYNQVVRRSTIKTVYRAFDKHEGIEVAWNQVDLPYFFGSNRNVECLYDEVQLLKTLNHQNIMKFFTIWLDIVNKNIIFVSEMFYSSLRQYRLKHRISIRTVKNWCRQILKGLVYLRSYDPPVIHSDLKCDNIFINGNDGTVKIGDLGLVAILTGKSHAADCIGIFSSLKVCSEILMSKKATALCCTVLRMSSGTSQFITPQAYVEEKYSELIDIYSFGMCVLEMVTSECPYGECSDDAEIYKRVISGDTPDLLYRVFPEIREFVKKCFGPRLSAMELLNDPFLRIDDTESDLRLLYYPIEVFTRQLRLDQVEIQSGGTDRFEYQLYKDYGESRNIGTSIRAKRRDDGSILLKLQVEDRKGRVRKIYFPFDVTVDSTLDVATEMATDLDSSDLDVIKISDMIDAELSSLIPEWTPWRAKYSAWQPQLLENQNDETYNPVEPEPSQFNAMARRKSSDSVADNLLGCGPSVQRVLAKEDETYNPVEPEPSQFNAMARRKSSDSLADNLLGCGPSVQRVLAKEDAFRRVPSIFRDQPSVQVPAKMPVVDQLSYLENKSTIHLGVPVTTTSPEAVPPASIRSRVFRRWKQKFFL